MTASRPVPAALGIDVGTAHVKVGLVGLDGALLALARRTNAMDRDPATGRAEQDPEGWWRGIVEGVREVVGVAGLGEDRVEVVGLSVDAHGPTLVAVDAEGRSVAPAITWQDTRAAAAGDAEALRASTGLEGWALGVLAAARWLEREWPPAASRARWYLNAWEALALRLSGVAGSFQAPGQVPIDAALLADSGVAGARLAPPLAAGKLLGGLLPAVAIELGLPPGTPVVAGMVDAFASFHGAGMTAPGDAIDVGGAAGGFGVYWNRPLEARGSFSGRAPLDHLWIVGGAMAATGAALEWFRDDVLGSRLSIPELIAEAAAVPPGADGLVFLPYLAGERSPLWDPAATGAFVGLTLGHGRGHVSRAILEAAALALRDVAQPILAAGARVDAMRVCGGPARSSTWNQIKADVTGFRVEVPAVLEAAVLGSAIVAAAGVGAHRDITSAIRAMARIDHVIEPDPRTTDRYDRLFAAYRALHPAIGPVLRSPHAAAPVPA